MKAITSNTISKGTVDLYLKDLHENIRITLEKLRKEIKAAAPKAEEGFSYEIPSFKFNAPFVGFVIAKNHCAFYFISPNVMKEFKDGLLSYDTSKGTIRFSPDKPLAAGLVKKIVKARLLENEIIVQQRNLKKTK